MTDNEIIKALECCSNGNACQEECPLNDLEDLAYCMSTLLQNTLDLINRQKAEIEDLQNELSAVKLKNSDLQSTYQALKIYLESMRSAANFYKMHYEESQAEIERLRVECRKQSVLWSEHFESLFQTAKETIRPKAIKEVTAELYNSFIQYETYDRHHTFEILDRIQSVEEFLLDNLIKEMEGGTDE